jgi:hypothetical protein
MRFDTADPDDGTKSKKITYVGTANMARTEYGYSDDNFVNLAVEYEYDANNNLIRTRIYTTPGVLTEFEEYTYYADSGLLATAIRNVAGVWHKYIYDEIVVAPATVGRVTEDITYGTCIDALNGVSALTTTTYTYGGTDLDVQTKTYTDHANEYNNTISVYYPSVSGAGIDDQLLKTMVKYYPVSEEGDDQWHRYTYDQVVIGAENVGRITGDRVYDSYANAKAGLTIGLQITTTYTYYGNTADVETKETIYAGPNDIHDTYATYYQGTGAGIDTQDLKTLVRFFAASEPGGDDQWHKYTYDQVIIAPATVGRVIEDKVYDSYVHAKAGGETGLEFVVVFTYHAGTSDIKTSTYYNNAAKTINTAYEKYTYDINGNMTEKVFYYDGATIVPGGAETGTPDNKWHKSSDFNADGQARDDLIYTGIDASGNLTGFELHIEYIYHTNGVVNIAEYYDNTGTILNDNYEWYTFDTDGNIAEKIFYYDGITIVPGAEELGTPDNMWHIQNNFTIAGGEYKAQDDYVYAEMPNKGFPEGFHRHVVYSYHTNGEIATTEYYDNVGTTVNTAYEKYTYDTSGNLTGKIFYYDGNTLVPGGNENAWTADNKWHKSSDFTVAGGGYKAQDDLIYTGIDVSGNLTGFQVHTVYTYYVSGRINTAKYYDNTGTSQTTAYEYFEYIDAPSENMVRHIFYYDGNTIVPGGDESGGAPDNNWHSSSDYTYDQSLNGYAQDDLVYDSLANLLNGTNTGLEYHVKYTYVHPFIDSATYYDNVGTVKNYNFEKYTYDNGTQELLEKVFYYDGNTIVPGGDESEGTPDNKWHVSSGFTSINGEVKALEDKIYDTLTNAENGGTTGLEYHVTYTYYSTGNLKTQNIVYNSDPNGDPAGTVFTFYNNSTNRMAIKQLPSADGNGNVRYDYYDESFDHDQDGTIESNEHYGRIYKTKRSDGAVFTTEAYYTGTLLKAKVLDGSAYPGDIYYYYDQYNAAGVETGFRKEESDGDQFEYRLSGGNYYLDKKVDAANSRTYWFLWDRYPSLGGVMVTPPEYWSGTSWVWRPFDKNSANPMDPDVDWDAAGTCAPESNLPELGAWPPSSIEYPVVGPLSSIESGAEEIDLNIQGACIKTEIEKDIAMLQDQASGDGVKIALLDSGVNLNILDITLSDDKDFTTFPGSGDEFTATVSDLHGTYTASVIKGNDDTGIAPDAELMSLKVYDDAGETSVSVISDAIKYAVDSGAKILNMPFNLYPVHTVLEDAIDYAVSKGTVMIASAGNDGAEILEDSLAAYDKIISVGSVDNDGKLSAWSNYGTEIDLYAPWDVVELDEAEEDKPAGTSFSAAFVTGVAALILEENPDISIEDLLKELKNIMIEPLIGKEENEKDEETGKKKNRGVLDEVSNKNAVLQKSIGQFTGYGLEDKSDLSILTK